MRKANNICLLLLITLGQGAPDSAAQGYMNNQGAVAERRLNEAESYFAQNDYQMGANRIVESCYVMKSSPQSGGNYIQVAASKVDFIDAKLNASLQRKDYDSAKTLLGAEQTLLTPLSNWEPQNPKWHYQKAKLFQIQSQIPMTGNGALLAKSLGVPYNLHNEMDMQPLRNSIQECETVLRMGDPSYRDSAQKLKTACETEIQRRTGNINKVNADWYRRQPRGIAPPGYYSDPPPKPAEHYCGKCGGSHTDWVCPFTHGG